MQEEAAILRRDPMLPAVTALWMTFGVTCGAIAGWWAVLGGLLTTLSLAVAGLFWSRTSGSTGGSE